jgi:hypothetical protein
MHGLTNSSVEDAFQTPLIVELGKEYSINYSELRFFGQIGDREDNIAAITATV